MMIGRRRRTKIPIKFILEWYASKRKKKKNGCTSMK
jgi:hypothetical protein